MFTYRSFKSYLIIALFLSTTSCDFLDGLKQKPDDGPSKVSGVSVSGNGIVINGSNLNAVKTLKISNGGQTTGLIITSQSSNQIIAKGSSPLSLVLGTVYNLMVSSASGDATFPITVQVADGSLNPSVLANAGASPGQVLKWNGSAWAPSNDNTGAGGGGSSSGFWLVRLDGTPIAQIISWGQNGSLSLVWDDADGMTVGYESEGPYSNLISSRGNGLYYSTANCSDSPHNGTYVPRTGDGPNTGLTVGGVLYKTESIADSLTLVALRQTDESGNLGPCAALPTSRSGSFFRITAIPSPGVPTSLVFGTYKIEKR